MTEGEKRTFSFNGLHFIGAAVAGLIVNKLLPVDWLIYAFTGSIGITVLMGILASIGSEESKPVSKPLKVLSYLVVGTSSPTAIVPISLSLKLFLLSATFVAAMTAEILFTS